MSFPINPYITGNHVGDSPAFVGRDDIVRRVRQILKQPNNNAIVLYGQRRIGKTSVLYELEAKLPKENAYHVVFFDLLDKSNWPLEKVLQKLAKQISDVLQQERLDLGNEPETIFREYLADCLKKIPLEQSLVLLFDEFDVFDVPENENKDSASAVFFPYLRQLLNIDRQRLNFVFVIGRKIDDMTTIAKSLFKTAPTKRVSLLNKEDTLKLIRLSERNKTLNWTDETIEKIWQLTSGHPYLTQHFCSHVWENIYECFPDKLPIVSLKNIEAVEQGDILEASRNTLEWLWDGLSLAAQIIACALAEAGTNGRHKTELEHFLTQAGVQRVIQKLNDAIGLLLDWDIIEDRAGRYHFRVELLRRWVAEYKSFDEALNSALSQAYPDAQKLYEKAQELYDDYFFEEALLLLRRVVLKHAYHIKANQLLADILLEQEAYNEAREILEKLYRFQPNGARLRLIQVLLLLIKSNNSEEEQLKLFERILEIDPKHPEAKRQKQNLLNRQEAKKQQRIETIKDIYDKHSKLMWDLLGFIFALLVSYYFLTDRIPTEPLIVLEVEQQLINEVSKYDITGVVSDQPYVLDTVKIFPKSEHPVKQARFKYDIYTQLVDLKLNPNTNPKTYWIDKSLLQQSLAEKDKHFSFKFLDKDRFTFYFQFEAPETTLAEFECQVFTVDKRKVSCQVREKGYLSLFRGLPWFGIGFILGIILILFIEIRYAFKKRKNNIPYQSY